MTRATKFLFPFGRSSKQPFVFRISVLAFLTLLVGGCASSFTGGKSVSTEVDWRGAAYFVERQPKDGRNLAEKIATALNARGLRAQDGEAGNAPQDSDYLVRYVDQWEWDMRVFLSNLKIEIRDPRTQAIIGYGQSVQTSLKAMGKTHQDIIEAAIAELFAEAGSTTALEQEAYTSENKE